MTVKNIEWEVDIQDGIDALDEMTAENAAETLGIPYAQYASMHTNERHEFAEDLWKRSSSSLWEAIGLPDEIEVPPEIVDEDDISDYISDQYGFCHKGFQVNERG